MWEHVVGPAGVDVEGLADERDRHGRAFDVPAGETRPPRAGPYLQAMLAGSLPEREVAGVMLARIDLAPDASEQLVGAVARQPAVSGKARDVVIDGAAHLVRVTSCNELFDELDHLCDVLRRSRVVVGWADIDQGGVGNERLRVVRRDLLGRF